MDCRFFARLDGDDELYIIDTSIYSFSRVPPRGVRVPVHSKSELSLVMWELNIPIPKEFNNPQTREEALETIGRFPDLMGLRRNRGYESWSDGSLEKLAQWFSLAEARGHGYSKYDFYLPLIKEAMVDQGRIVSSGEDIESFKARNIKG